MVTVILALLAVAETHAVPTPPAPQSPGTIASLSGLGGGFLENLGQWDPRARFLLSVPGLDLWITNDGAVYDRHQYEDPAERILMPESPSNAYPTARTGHVFRTRFVGAKAARFERKSTQPGVTNYIRSSDPHKWVTGAKTHGEVLVRGLYHGVDARWYLDASSPRYDLIVRPGAEAGSVSFVVEGAEHRIAPTGELIVETALGPVVHRAPVVYQDGPQGRKAVVGRYQDLPGGRVGFEVGDYDRTRDLVIDPLVWVTYTSGSGNDFNGRVRVASDGAVLVGLYSTSGDFPTSVGAYDESHNGGQDFVVAKLTNDGATRLWSTFIGGPGNESLEMLRTDAAGNVYVAGFTSGGFPITSGAAQSAFGGGSWDGVVLKLSPSGSSLDYASYIGGPGADFCWDMAMDATGIAYVCGGTQGGLTVTSGCYDGTFSGPTDGFIAKMARNGRSFTYLTYMGSGAANVSSVSLLPSGELAFCGITLTPGLATTLNAYDASFDGYSDWFFGRINASGTTVPYLTYLGGPGAEGEVDTYMRIQTGSDGYVRFAAPQDFASNTGFEFPNAGPQFGWMGGQDAVLGIMPLDGTPPMAVIRAGGNGEDLVVELALTPTDGLLVSGVSKGPGIFGHSGYGGSNDAFGARVSADLSALYFSYLDGGGDGGVGHGICAGPLGRIYQAVATSNRRWTSPNTYSWGGGGAWDTALLCWDEYVPVKLYGFGLATIPELATYSFRARVDGDPNDLAALRYGLIGAPSGATIDPITGVFSWTPTEEQGPGEYTFEISVEGGGDDDYKEITLTVTEVSDNRPPVLNPIGNRSASTGYPLTFTASATDPDAGQSLTYSLVGAPSGATIGSNSGVFQWTPGTAGSYSLTVRVTDDGTPPMSDEETITVTVSDLAVASLTLDPTSVVGGATSSTGTVTLNQGAPQGGVSVTLASTDPTAASVPNAVAVPEGQTSATFEIQTFPVATAKTPTISATRGNTVQAVLTVNPPALDALTIAPNPQEGGLSTVGRLTLTGPAPAGGFAVAVSTNSPSLVSFDSGTVTVGAGQTQWNFTVYTQVVEYRRDATVTAAKNGVSRSFVLTLLPPAIRLSVPSSVGPGSISTGTVTVSQVSGSGTNVTLSGGSGIVTIPSSVTIGAGQTSASFPITAVGTGTATVTAGLPTGQTASGNITVASGTTVSGTISLNGRASLVGEELTIQVRQAGTSTVLASYNVVIASGNAYSFVTSLSGTHDLSAKFRTSLRKKLAGVALGAGRDFVLINGDVNGDDTVNIADFLALRAAFGSSPASANWNRNADLNGDGSVNVSDFLILRAGFGKSGDP